MTFFEIGFFLIFVAIGAPIYTGAYLLIRKKDSKDLRDFDDRQKNGTPPTLDMQGANADRLCLKISFWIWLVGVFLLIVGVFFN
jgi:hypothetical protein